MNIEVFAYSTVILVDTVVTNFKVVGVAHALTLTQATDSGLNVQGLRSLLTVRQDATATKSLAITITQQVSFSHGAIARCFVENVSDFVSLQQYPIADNLLPPTRVVIGSSVDVQVAKGTYSVLGLSQSVKLNISRNISVTSQVTLKTKALGFMLDKRWLSRPITIGEALDG